MLESCNVVVTFESVDEIIHHSNKPSFSLLSHSTIKFAFQHITKWNLEICRILTLAGTLGSEKANVFEDSKRVWHVWPSVFSFHCDIYRFHNQVRLHYNSHLHVTPKPKWISLSDEDHPNTVPLGSVNSSLGSSFQVPSNPFVAFL